MKIAFLGGRGIPARYSGYDTLIEELSVRLAKDRRDCVFVFCRSSYYKERTDFYRDVRLIYLSAPRLKGFESLFNSLISTIYAVILGLDIIYFVDPANAPFCLLSRLFGKTVVIHTDGLGWKRKKWSSAARRYYKTAEWLCVRSASALITDNPEMRSYYRREYGANSVLISYGAFNDYGTDPEIYGKLGVCPKKYHLIVARLEPENNTDLIIQEYGRSRAAFHLLIVGDSPYNSRYMAHLRAISDPRVNFLGRIQDQKVLNSLYQGAYLYIHGHEVGGTNPSLLRAMGQGTAPLVLDVSFNKAVIGNCGYAFNKEYGDLANKLECLEKTYSQVEVMGISARLRAEALFNWELVTSEHKKLFLKLFEEKRG